ncbi:endoplasmic reticulum protein [Flagelloscypha sp. PMI_526]|nr:endoplasmic reticulum protein [Flagelloscypha sp. PMI_526]
MFPPYTFAKQPLKTLYLIYQVLTTVFVRVPIWTLIATLPWTRQRKSWTMKREVMVKIVRHLLSVVGPQVGRVGNPPDHTRLVLGKGVSGLWVGPVPRHLIQADIATLAEAANVEPIRVPAYWFHNQGSGFVAKEMAQPGEKILLFFHGGGYIRLSAHPSDATANVPRGFVQNNIFRRVLSVEYRLSSTDPLTEPTHPFPAALLDALAGYMYLVDSLGFSPSNIVVGGDSAGGNLSHALTRYLCEQNGEIPGLPAPPGALILASPWVDLYDLETKNPDSSLHAYEQSDYLQLSHGPSYPHRAFTGIHGLGLALYNRYISPAGLHPKLVSGLSFKGFPRTFIIVGGAEILHDSIVRLKDRMVADIGENNVRYYRAPDGIHDYLVFPWHEPERSDTYKSIAAWL